MKNSNKVDNTKIACIVAEYNPFHFGHLHQIEKVKKELSPDLLVVIISGSFTQRGDLCIANKFVRSQWAIEAGVDLVIELPTIYTLSNAKTFAIYSIKILQSLFDKFTLVFSAENSNVNDLKKVVEHLQSDVTNEKIKKFLDEGFSYGKSCELSIDIVNSNFWSPNNILGIEYINAIKLFQSEISFHVIERENKFMSSSQIRQKLIQGEKINKFVPKFVEINKRVDLNAIEKISLYNLNSKTSKNLKEILNVVEGFENKIKKSYFKNLEEYYNLTSKRYTLSNLKRILACINLNILKSDLDLIKSIKPYTTLLAINPSKKNQILSLCSKKDCHFLYKSSDNTIQKYNSLIDIDNRSHIFNEIFLR